MHESKHLSRRQFVGTAAVSAAAAIVPREVLGGAKHVAPSEKVRIGYVGCGTQGLRQLMTALGKSDVQIVAVCDPNRKSDDYPEWSHHELNNKIRKFLDDPQWAKTARGGLCGREVGKEIVDRHYAKQQRSGTGSPCRAYADFREMLDKQQDLDAVYVMTPDHLHAAVTVRAMRKEARDLPQAAVERVGRNPFGPRHGPRDGRGVAHVLLGRCSQHSPALRVAGQWRDRAGARGPQLVVASLLAARHARPADRAAAGSRRV